MNSPPQQARRARSGNAACGAALVMCQGWVLLSAVFIPVLLTSRPVVLELVNGSLLAVAAGGAFVRSGHASLAAALTAPLAIWLPVDAVSWWAGHRFGVGVAKWLTVRYPGRASAVASSERFVDKFGVLAIILGPVLPLPTALIFAATGWRRIPLALVIIVDAVGTVARGSLALAAGYAYGDQGISIARRFSEYSALATGVIIAAICIIIVIRVRYAVKGQVRTYRHSDTNAEDD